MQMMPLHEVKAVTRASGAFNEKVKVLVEDIRENGLREPVKVDKRGFVVDGNKRVAAFQRLRLEEIPVVVVEDSADVSRGVGSVGTMGNDKIERYGWSKNTGNIGSFEWLHKEELLIDPVYQRGVSDQRALAIARTWKWEAVGVLIVAARDGMFYVIDGQHRLLAAKRRADITTLPCRVFENVNEAKVFLDCNVQRRPLKSLEKFAAQLMSGDNVAVQIDRDLKSRGFSVPKKSSTANPKHVCCLSAMLDAWKKDRDLALEAFDFCAFVCDGKEQIRRDFFDATFAAARLERKRGRSIGESAKRMKRIGINVINAEMKNSALLLRKDHLTAWLHGFVKCFNKGLPESKRIRLEFVE